MSECRIKFERYWLLCAHVSRDLTRTKTGYKDMFVNNAWKLWQAGWKAAEESTHKF